MSKVQISTTTFCLMWQFPSKEEEQHTFRTTPQGHWWIGRSAQGTPKL